jgi:hypothetical protein
MWAGAHIGARRIVAALILEHTRQHQKFLAAVVHVARGLSVGNLEPMKVGA